MADGASAESAVSVSSPSSSIAAASPSALSLFADSLATQIEALACGGKPNQIPNYRGASDESEVYAESEIGSSHVHSEIDYPQVYTTDGEAPRELSGGDSDSDAAAKNPTMLDRIRQEASMLGELIQEKALDLALNHRFDQLVLFSIGCNCIMLACTDPTWEAEDIPQWFLIIEFIFSGIFFVECIVKVVGYGSPYFHDNWNRLDFIVVIESILSIVFEYGGVNFSVNVSILRVLRVLRPLRSVNKFPMLKTIINASIATVPQLGDIFVVFFAYISIFAIIATTLWSGLLRYRCTNVDSSENAIVYSVDADDYDPEATPYEPYTDDDGIGSYGIIPNEDSVCYAELELDKRECIPDKALPLSSSALRCDSGSSCMRLDDYENPLYGLHGFDNMAQSFFNVFMICQFEDWDYLMVLTQAVSGEWVVIFYALTIVTGACILVNLVVAAIMVQIRKALELEETKSAHETDKDEEGGELLHTYIKEESPAIKSGELALRVGGEPVATNGGAPALPMHDSDMPESFQGQLIDQTAEYELGRLKAMHEKGLLDDAEYKEGKEAVVAVCKEAFFRFHQHRGDVEAVVFENSLQSMQPKVYSRALPSPSNNAPTVSEEAKESDAAKEFDFRGFLAAQLASIDYQGFRPDKVFFHLKNNRVTRTWKRSADEWAAGIDLEEAGLLQEEEFLPESLPITGDMLRWLSAGDDSPFSLLMTLAILGNTVVLALDNYETEGDLRRSLDALNVFFVWLFAGELLIVVGVMGFPHYHQDMSNLLDAFVALISVVEALVSNGGSQASMLRMLRILRITRSLRAAKKIKAFRTVFQLIANGVKATIPELLLLLLFCFMASILGMQLFGGTLASHPVIRFDSFMWSFVQVFVTLSGEDWPTAAAFCMQDTGWYSVLYFICLVLFGQYFILNLVLAVLLESCALDTRNASVIARRFRLLVKKLSHSAILREAFVIWVRHDPDAVKAVLTRSPKRVLPPMSQLIRSSSRMLGKSKEEAPNTVKMNSLHFVETLGHERLQTDWEHACEKLSHNRKYKVLIMMFILLSCALLLTNVSRENNPGFYWTTIFFNIISTVVFMFDFVITASFRGLTERKHVDEPCVKESPMLCLDFGIIIGMIIDLTAQGYDAPQGLLHFLAVLLCLRPLRIIVRIPALLHILGILTHAMAELGLTFLFTLFLGFCFAILGQQLFSGTFHTCVDKTGSVIKETHGLPWVTCNKDGPCYDTCKYYEGEFQEARYSFDNIGDGLWSIFVLMTMEGFMSIMYSGIAATEPKYFPIPGNNVSMSIYFMLVIVIFAFFFIQLFLGVVFDAFVVLRSTDKSGSVLSEDERADKVCLDEIKRIAPPKLTYFSEKSLLEQLIYRVVYSKVFDHFIMAILSINAVILCLQYDGAPLWIRSIEEYGNFIFCTIYFVEMCMKIAVYGMCAYWHSPSDAADGLISLMGVVDTLLYCGNCRTVTIVRVLRSLRVIRILRLLTHVKSLGVIVRAVMAPWYMVLLICLLLGITIFIYATVGCVLFDPIENDEIQYNYLNFDTVIHAMMMLFVVGTGSEWTDFVADLWEAAPDGMPIFLWDLIVTFYFISYLILLYFLFLNIFIMVICDAFEVLGAPHRVKIEQGAASFAKLWRSIDEEGLGVVPIRSHDHGNDLFHLLAELEAPLGVGEMDTKKIEALIMHVLVEMHAEEGIQEVEYSQVLMALCRVALSMHSNPDAFEKKQTEAHARSVLKRQLRSMRARRKLDPVKAQIRSRLRELDEDEKKATQAKEPLSMLFCGLLRDLDLDERSAPRDLDLDERAALEMALALRDMEDLDNDTGTGVDKVKRAREIFRAACEVAKQQEIRSNPGASPILSRQFVFDDEELGVPRGVDVDCWGK